VVPTPPTQGRMGAAGDAGRGAGGDAGRAAAGDAGRAAGGDAGSSAARTCSSALKAAIVLWSRACCWHSWLKEWASEEPRAAARQGSQRKDRPVKCNIVDCGGHHPHTSIGPPRCCGW
jgi:hypothetical protein